MILKVSAMSMVGTPIFHVVLPWHGRFVPSHF